MKRRCARKTGVVVFVTLTALMLSGYREKEEGTEASAHKVLDAVLTCPNDALFFPSMTYIGLGTDMPDESEQEQNEERLEAEQDAWQEAVGDCFDAEGFDSFFDSYERTYFHGYAWAHDLELSVLKMEDQEPTDRVGHVLVTLQSASADGEEQTYELDWRIIYDSEKPELLQKLELISDGGLGEELAES